jgi:excisionase family DNA binding protein
MSDPTENSEYLKIGEAARFLGVTRRTVYRRVWSGDLPASKVGGLYFIRRDDLKALLAQGRPISQDEQQPEAAPLKCSYCYRLLDDSQIGLVCRAEGCDEPICSQCQAEGVQHCAQHSPTRADRLQDAQAAYARGEISLLLKSSSARLREISFLNRIHQRLARINTLLHPSTGDVLSIPDWDAILEKGDDRAEVLRLLGKVMMDDLLVSQAPLNGWMRYRLPIPKGKLAAGTLEVLVYVLSRLGSMVRDGFDTTPLAPEELTPLLLRLTEEAQRDRVARLVVLAATTGWDAPAREFIQGSQAGSSGGSRPTTGSLSPAFSNRQVIFYLFDLQSGELIYNRKDDRSRRYAELFAPLLPSEEIEETIAAIQDELETHESLTLDQAEDALQSACMPSSPGILKQAFEKMAATGRFSVLEVPGYGLSIVRNR